MKILQLKVFQQQTEILIAEVSNRSETTVERALREQKELEEKIKKKLKKWI